MKLAQTTAVLLFCLNALTCLDRVYADDVSHTKIIGGEEVTESDPVAKTTVAIMGSLSICTGSILDHDLIITAAHCLSSPSEMAVAFSRSVLQAGVTKARIIKAIIPKEYREDAVTKDQYDIGLIRFEGGLPPGYEKADLIPDSAMLSSGGTTLLAGYGITNASSHEGAGILRKTSIKIKDVAFAKTEVLLDQTEGHGACHGDSGGPAFIHQGGRLYLWGVTNRGFPEEAPDDCAHHAVYTNILAHQSWLSAAIEQIRH